MFLSLSNPTAAHDQLPGFGNQHLSTLRSEAQQAQDAKQMLLALAHGTRYRDDSMADFVQHSTLFVATPHDADVCLRIGNHIVFEGRLTAGNVYWTFVNWDQTKGDLVLVNGSTYNVPRERILQKTLMTCILFHPRMEVTDPLEAKPDA